MEVNTRTKHAMVATALAGLFATMVVPTAVSAQTEGLVRCHGVNACKGQSACKSATNACAGKNGCKGQGYLRLSEKECRDKGGKVGGKVGTPIAPEKKGEKKP
jgi:uncharacterized membrane protein